MVETTIERPKGKQSWPELQRKKEKRLPQPIKLLTKIELAASTDKTRPIMNGVYANAEKQRFEATDGKMLAVIPYFGIEESGIIPLDAVKHARKVADRKEDPELTVTRDVVAAGGKEFRTVGGTFPNVEPVIPSKAGRVKVSLDAQALLDLANALGTRSDSSRVGKRCRPVTLYIEPKPSSNTEYAILVEGHHNQEGSFGVLMRVRL